MTTPLLLGSFLPALLLISAAPSADEKAVPAEVLQRLKDSDPEERLKGLKALMKVGVEGVPHVVELLKDSDGEVREAAAYTLRVLRIDSKILLETLKAYVKHDNAHTRAGVVGALGKCGPDALPLILPALKDADANVRKQAVLTLQPILQKSPQTGADLVPPLAAVLKDENEAVRLSAVQVLPRCGDSAVKALLEASDDASGKIRANALGGLGILPKLDATIVLPALQKRIKEDEEGIVRQSAARTLGKLGAPGAPPLIGALSDKEEAVQMASLRALGSIGVPAKAAIVPIEKLARDAANPGLRTAAVLTLAKLGPDADATLIGLLKDGDSSTRMACLQCFGKAMKTPKAALPNLIVVLDDKDPKVQAMCAYVIAQLGPDAKDALPALKKTMDANKENELVQSVIEKALKKIDGK